MVCFPSGGILAFFTTFGPFNQKIFLKCLISWIRRGTEKFRETGIIESEGKNSVRKMLYQFPG